MTAHSETPEQSPAHPLTYPQWLARHSDEDIAQLLRTTRAQGVSWTNEPLPGTPAEPSLRHLTALQLAILHAAVELDAAFHPVSLPDLRATLTELFDISGTPATARPSTEDVSENILQLTHLGLLFAPELSLTSADLDPEAQLKIPAHLPALFDPTTDQLWRLADCHRCPIPTDELPGTVEGLPPRQRRLLGTLSMAGGVGHSATLRPDADPEAPLPTMVRLGVLDQLDDSTARLSGRVATYLRGGLIAPAGGSFPSFVADATLPPSTFSPTLKADSAGSATAVQTIQELSALIHDIGAHPIQPLTNGGLGTRELGKVARRLDFAPELVLQRLTELHLCNLLAREFPEPPPRENAGQTQWSITELALDFLEAPLATQWAILLLGWAGSPYQTWRAREEESRPLEPQLNAPIAKELRAFFPGAFTAPNSAGFLWAARPALAAETTHVAWTHLVQEATQLGLLATDSSARSANPAPSGTSALRALSEVLVDRREKIAADQALSFAEVLGELAEKLQALLPDPVDMLIVQGDHTIMAPGILRSEDHQMLARFADAESTGMASVWRVSKSSVHRALSHGDSASSILVFLSRLTPGGEAGVPQSLRYLLEDADRALAEGTVALSQQAHAIAHRVPTPQRHTLETTHDYEAGDSRELAEAVESFRRTLQSESIQALDGSTSTANTRTVRTSREIMSELRRAYSAGTKVRLHYVDHAGARARDWISIVMMSPSTISAVVEDSGDNLVVQPHRVAALEVPI
ncbi:helicase-associated domain-containing protein [Corynebacterium suicordis]|uniref:Helicase-associated domain-containing protein n=1 Tax=Corynebacterium suicordis DSM 45110 TaxID=1121369 RepID=A0ABR9ZMC5_9CORY|nr:helicase-associated domain-containing protein [Corynebacterium suicordis]MBF4554078.1 helicase-associated domain-containing protein [Corynebacterium suicordis DSM 45110]MDR6276943.1 hypothetical protein [Corynebacterium suicordis]